MRGRWLVLSAVAGCWLAHQSPSPGLAVPWVSAVLPAVLLLGWVAALSTGSRWGPVLSMPAACLMVAWLSLAWASWQVEQRGAQRLPAQDEDRISRVELTVVSLPRVSAEGLRFQATVESSRPAGVPPRIEVFWPSRVWQGHGPPSGGRPVGLPEVVPGQRWRMALNLRPPRGQRNPWGFDYEQHVFAQGVRAMGTVRGQPASLGDDPWGSLEVVANRARHHVRDALHAHVAGWRYGPVLQALVIGDQAGVSAEDWVVFNRSGLTHLVSISGSHVTMVAVLGGLAAGACCRRLRWRGQRLTQFVPARLPAAWAALLVAWLYCLLAGWGVPARRTFYMLAAVAACWGLRLPLSGGRTLALAAAGILVLDPWAVLASGFWLSFGAVGVLMMAGQAWLAAPAGDGWRRRATRVLMLAVTVQCAISLALLPLLAAWFHEISLISPLTNAYAIPVMGWLVTPLALLAGALALLPGADLPAQWVAAVAHGLLMAMMAPTVWMAHWPVASLPAAAAPWYATAAAAAGVVYALLPHGLPARWCGWWWMLPVLAWRGPTPAPGDWSLVALDVGQASAVVVRTHRHVLVFDTGMRRGGGQDDGGRAVVPFLRAWGVRRIDALVVSHADLDHAGGLATVLSALPVGQVYASFDVPAYLTREARQLNRAPPDAVPLSMPCRAGQYWRMDGVDFHMLWPAEASPPNVRAGNAQSCVLAVAGRDHAALLTGDIGAAQEQVLLQRGLPPMDVVLAAHHGSRHSSTPAWVDALQATHVVAQAGAWNRHGHPHPTVEQRWQRSGARFWRTDRDGAVWVDAVGGALRVTAMRDDTVAGKTIR